jgi:hypothetical protein
VFVICLTRYIQWVARDPNLKRSLAAGAVRDRLAGLKKVHISYILIDPRAFPKKGSTRTKMRLRRRATGAIPKFRRITTPAPSSFVKIIEYMVSGVRALR